MNDYFISNNTCDLKFTPVVFFSIYIIPEGKLYQPPDYPIYYQNQILYVDKSYMEISTKYLNFNDPV